MGNATSRTLLALVVLLAACGKEADGKRALPPATGSGAPPLPQLPAVAQAAPRAPTAATSISRATGTLLPHAEVAVVAQARGVLTALAVEVGAVPAPPAGR